MGAAGSSAPGTPGTTGTGGVSGPPGMDVPWRTVESSGMIGSAGSAMEFHTRVCHGCAASSAAFCSATACSIGSTMDTRYGVSPGFTAPKRMRACCSMYAGSESICSSASSSAIVASSAARSCATVFSSRRNW
ncbi:hypothetical protein BFG51_09360 [Dietzia alimentaria]|nr:hypothetical protein BFG51_09360 [Dietzia alimentaria]